MPTRATDPIALRESDGKADTSTSSRSPRAARSRAALQEALDGAIGKLPIPKVMRYASPAAATTTTIEFVRPAHRLLALHGADVVPVTALGLAAGRTTDGHRFLSRGDIDDRERRRVRADARSRRQGRPVVRRAPRATIVRAARRARRRAPRSIMPDALLDEVTALVEWPVVYAGTFDPAFLAVPQECLILTMQQNQKYFALADERGRLRAPLPAGQQPRRRGIRRRSSQATSACCARGSPTRKFFFDQDRKATLETRVAEARAASSITTSSARRRDRASSGCAFSRATIAPRIGADPSHAERAALLAKADLVTDMVGEFPELQGTMGRYYAQHDGEPPDVADAIAQHYWPRFAGDALPEGPVAQAVALADKLEALAGLFGIGAGADRRQGSVRPAPRGDRRACAS